ncbi:hypothetical protein Bca101_082519 [Brassica carinata]
MVIVVPTSLIFTIGGLPTKQKKFGSSTKLRQWFLCSGVVDSSFGIVYGALFVFDLEKRTFGSSNYIQSSVCLVVVQTLPQTGY